MSSWHRMEKISHFYLHLYVTPLAPRISRWLLLFWKICALPLIIINTHFFISPFINQILCSTLYIPNHNLVSTPTRFGTH